MRIIDRSFIKAPRRYIVQSLLALVAVAIILLFVEVLTHAVIVAALGSTAFVVFAMPRSVTAQPRRLIGGHVVGLLSGTLCYYVFLAGPFGKIFTGWEFTVLLVYALAVGLSIFLMAVTNTEHAPAAGTALGVIAHTWSYQIVIFVLVGAVSLAIVRWLLRGYLRNLFE